MSRSDVAADQPLASRFRSSRIRRDEALRRNCEGVIAKARRNAAVKWLWLEYPS